MSDKPRRWGSWLAIAIFALLGLALIARPVLTHWEHIRNETTKARLEQLGLALKAYHDDHSRMPPAFVLGPDGRPWHSWRVLLLPYLDRIDLAALYRMDEPWDSPANMKLVRRCPEVFQLPTSDVTSGHANACVIIGRRTAWPAFRGIRYRDFTDGTSNTILLAEALPRREWTNPLDLNVREFLRDRQALAKDAASWVLMADGSARRFNSDFNGARLANVLTPSGRDLTFRGDDWPSEFVDSDSSSAMSQGPVDSSTLSHTAMHSSWNEKLHARKNNLWCAVFQLCWDQLKNQTGGPVTVAPRSKHVDLLNGSPFSRALLDPSAYVLSTGSANPASTEALRRELNESMPDLDPNLTELPGPNPSVRLFAALKKSIRYHEQLEGLPGPLQFKSTSGRTPVRAFGKEPKGSNAGEAVLTETVYIGDYVSDDDFIVVLRTEGGRDDEVILALIEPGNTLSECWRRVDKRLTTPHRNRAVDSLREGESLRVPVLDFHIRHDFEELIELTITNMPGPGRPPAVIKAAQETIAYRLDERGAELLAQAEVAITFGSMGIEEPPPFDPQRPRHFVLDRPFLLAMREAGASHPYLLCWVAMPDIMESVRR